MEIDELLAREAIRDLVARYNANGDSGRFDQVLALFAADAVMEIVNDDGTIAVHDGLANIAQIFTGTRDALRGSVAGGPVRHFTATHQIDLIDPDHATGRLYFAVVMPGGLDHWGRYLDRYVRGDGGWRFQRRKVITDGWADASPFRPG